MTIGEHIKEERIKKGMSQGALAKKMNISSAMIGHWESGRRVPKMETVSRIAVALGVSVSDLLPSIDLGSGVIEENPDGKLQNYDMNDPADQVSHYMNHMDAEGKKTVVTVAKEIARSQGYGKSERPPEGP